MLAPTTPGVMVFAESSTPTPRAARVTPAPASLVSFTLCNASGASARPSKSAPQKNEGEMVQKEEESALKRRGEEVHAPPTQFSLPTYTKNKIAMSGRSWCNQGLAAGADVWEDGGFSASTRNETAAIEIASSVSAAESA